MRHSANMLNHPVTAQISGSVNDQIAVQFVKQKHSCGNSKHFSRNKQLENKIKSLLLHQIEARLSETRTGSTAVHEYTLPVIESGGHNYHTSL